MVLVNFVNLEKVTHRQQVTLARRYITIYAQLICSPNMGEWKRSHCGVRTWWKSKLSEKIYGGFSLKHHIVEKILEDTLCDTLMDTHNVKKGNSVQHNLLYWYWMIYLTFPHHLQLKSFVACVVM